MFDDVGLVERRLRRELWERLLPLVHRDRAPLTVAAGPDPEHLEPVAPGHEWGTPWGTTWFGLDGQVPERWAGGRVEAIVDLGFRRDPPGFQCEGLVVERAADGGLRPLHGVHPRRMTTPVAADPGPVSILVEAAANPSFPQFRPSPMGSPATAPDRPLYRFRRAELVLVDPEMEALVHDLDVIGGTLSTLADDDPRRPRLAVLIGAALDRLARSPGDPAAARRMLAPALEPAVGAARRHRTIATGHAHIDTAWLWPMRETVRKCVRTFSSAVQLLDEYPEHRFACSQAQQYAWVEDGHPELFEAIRAHVEAGRWVPVGGMWVEADMNLPSAESLARQIVHGQRWFEERFGRRCTEMWIPDVFGYPAGLPQLFAAGGMTRFVTQKLSWNQQNRFPHHTFWWEGMDGTRVLTHFPPVDTYNAEITPAEVDHAVRGFRDHGWSGVSLMPFGYGDGGGGPTAEMLERRRRLADLDPRTTVEIGTPAELFAAVEREIARGASPPVWRGELYFEMHRGTLTSQLRTKLGNRRCERLLVEAELWAATGGAHADVDELWREVLTQQFHDVLPGTSIAWVHADAEATFERVGARLEAIVDDRLRTLLPPGRWLANPAGVDVDGVVVLDAAVADRWRAADAEEAAVGDVGDVGEEGDVGDVGEVGAVTGSAALGAAGASQVLADGGLAFGATVPAFGTAPATAGAVDDRVVVTESSMVNGRLAVRWDEAGALTSIIDLARAREVVPAGARAAVLEIAPDRPVEYDAWDLEVWTRDAGVVVPASDVRVVDRGPLVGRVAVHSELGPSSATVTYELRAGSPELLVHVDLDWHHDEHLLSMAFPLDVRADTAACDVQLGLVHRPTHRSTSWDAAKFEVCAHRFVDVAEPGFGVAVLNDGRYGHGLADGAVRVSLARAAKYPDPDADHGSHAVTLGVLPHGVGRASVLAAAQRLNAPPRLVVVERPAELGVPGGTLAAAPPGAGTAALPAPVVRLSGPGADSVEVDAVKLADDRSGDLVVRLHEALGDRAAVTMATSRRIGGAWRCDLLEEPRTGEEVGDGVVVLVLRPFELVTLRLRTVDGSDGRSARG